jgi:hypothetical protein
MCIKMGLFSSLARSRVASSRNCQATGVLACFRTYGLLLSEARFRNGSRDVGAVGGADVGAASDAGVPEPSGVDAPAPRWS